MRKLNKKIKKFLSKNEIYLSTTSTILLSIMALVLTCNSNKIAEQQLKISYNENKPNFKIFTNYIIDRNTGKAIEIDILINKYGGIANNINVSYASYFELSFEDKQNNVFNNNFRLFNYYDQSFNDYGDINFIKKIKGFRNNENLSNFEKALDKRIKEKGYRFISTKTKTYIRISYINFLNEKKVEYFLIDEIGEAYSINDSINEVEELIFRHNPLKKRIFLDSIDKMNIDGIINKVFN